MTVDLPQQGKVTSTHTAWYVCATVAGIILIGAVPIYYSHYIQSIHSDPYGLGQFNVPFQVLIGVSDMVSSLMSFALAILLFWRKPNDRMALFVSFFFLITAVTSNVTLDYFLMTYGGTASTREIYRHLQTPLWILLFCVFPDGRFVPRWTRWVFLFSILASFSFLAPPEWRVILDVVAFPQFILVMYAQVYRYGRVSSDAERQQTKWVVFGALMEFVFFVIGLLIYKKPGPPLINIIPLTLAIAILRSRLWDIDIIISRTLVYSTLIAFITGLYVLVVGSLSSLLQNQNDLAVPLIALLIVAALVQPLRRALQNNVNRLLRFDPGRRDETQVALQKSSGQSEEAQEESIQIHVIAKEDSSPYTRLQGRWLFIARLAWLLFTLTCIWSALSFVFLALSWATPVPDTWGFRGDAMLLALAFGSIGLLLARRHPQNPIGWLLLLAGLISSILEFCVEYATYALLTKAGALPYGTLAAWIASWIWVAAIGMFIYSFLLFPTGHLPSERWRPVAWFFVGAFGLMTFAFMIRPGPLYFAPYLDNPFAVQVAHRVLSPIPLAAAAAILLVGISVILRLRRAEGIERQQLKWFAYAATLRVIFGISESVAEALGLKGTDTKYFQYLSVVIWIAIAVAIAFAILRYRLWDIDIIINRTLVYGALTASVVGLYILIVGGLSISLQTQNNLPSSVLAILAIAFLFQPLRQRLQRIADRFAPVSQAIINPSIAEPAGPTPQTKQEQKIAVTDSAPSTILRGHWLLVARLAWASVFITLTAIYAFGFLVVHETLSTICEAEPCTVREKIQRTDAGDKVVHWQGPPVGFADRLRPDQVEALETLGLTLDQYGWLGALQMGLPALVFLVIAAGLFWWKSDDWMVLFSSILLATFPSGNMPLPFILGVRQPAWQWVFDAAQLVAASFFLIFPLLFPNGRFVPRWTRWMVSFHIAFAVITTLFRNSISGNLAEYLVFPYVLISICTGVYAQVYRYFRVASSVERQQIKWVVVGLAVFAVTAFGLVPLDALLTSREAGMDPARVLRLSIILDTIFQVTLLFVPVSITISVLRYRLWDIDIIINRTLVYGTLTAAVVSAFVIIVGLLSILIQSSSNSIIAVIATGLIALLFNPLRQRLQHGINHLMYGERDDPYVALSRLGQRLEAAYAPESILPTIVETVAQTLKLPYVGIALNQDGDFKIAAEFGRSKSEPINLPLIYQGEPVGELILAPRAPGEHFTSSERQLLDDLARQAGVAAHAVHLTADLQRSRERLVLAREEERRRLRRDLHDDLAPTLASLGLTASTAADLISTNPTTATKLVKELQTEIRATVGNIRRLVYDLRPPTLDELGLLAAIRERATQYSNAPDGFHVTVDEPTELPTLPAAVEVAAYRIVQEALENVSKHSQARQCTIRFVNHNGLEIEITDDGIGLPPNITPGVGLRSMRERAEELGGTCTIERGKNGGTYVLACLPIGEFDGTLAHPDRG